MRYSAHDTSRNVGIQEWVELFQSTAKTHRDVLFLLLGEGELRAHLESVGVAENCRFAGLERMGAMADFALIHAADGFLGGPSGPAIVALLSCVPYLFYRYKLINERSYLVPPAPFPWATEAQCVHWLDHDDDGLIAVFDRWLGALEEKQR